MTKENCIHLWKVHHSRGFSTDEEIQVYSESIEQYKKLTGKSFT